MVKKKTNTDNKSTYVVAFIGLVGVIAAAVISILPDIVELNRKSAEASTLIPITSTSTPILNTSTPRGSISTSNGVSKYDDLSGIFSIQYPSHFHVNERLTSDKEIYVSFSSDDYIFDDAYISVSAGKKDGSSTDTFTDITGLIFRIISGGNEDSNEREFVLISNMKTERGNYTVLRNQRKTQNTYFHYLVESENNTYVIASVKVRYDSISDTEIESIIHSFSWSSSAILNFFK